ISARPKNSGLHCARRNWRRAFGARSKRLSLRRIGASPRRYSTRHAMSEALAAELAEHRRWRLKPPYENFRAFDALVQNESRPPEQHAKHLAHGVRQILRFAVDHVPYYKNLFAKHHLRLEEI